MAGQNATISLQEHVRFNRTNVTEAVRELIEQAESAQLYLSTRGGTEVIQVSTEVIEVSTGHTGQYRGHAGQYRGHRGQFPGCKDTEIKEQCGSAIYFILFMKNYRPE